MGIFNSGASCCARLRHSFWKALPSSAFALKNSGPNCVERNLFHGALASAASRITWHLGYFLRFSLHCGILRRCPAIPVHRRSRHSDGFSQLFGEVADAPSTWIVGCDRLRSTRSEERYTSRRFLDRLCFMLFRCLALDRLVVGWRVVLGGIEKIQQPIERGGPS